MAHDHPDYAQLRRTLDRAGIPVGDLSDEQVAEGLIRLLDWAEAPDDAEAEHRLTGDREGRRRRPSSDA